MENTGVPADPPPNPESPYARPESPYARPAEGPPPYPYAAPPPQPYPYAGPPAYPYSEPLAYPPQPSRTSKWLIPSIVIFAVVVLGCVSGVGLLIVRGVNRTSDTASAIDAPHLNRPGFGSSDAPLPETTETAAAGPRAATYPVGEEEDLNRVCDQWYYPTAPKYAGAGPHQISIGVVSDKGLEARVMNRYVAPYSVGAAARTAWEGDKPAKSQLMACVDIVSVGGLAKKCKFDDPEPDTVSLRKATYQLRLFEVATGRKLVDKKLVGEDEVCPTMVFVGADKTIYSKPADRQLYELLKPYVLKKL